MKENLTVETRPLVLKKLEIPLENAEWWRIWYLTYERGFQAYQLECRTAGVKPGSVPFLTTVVRWGGNPKVRGTVHIEEKEEGTAPPVSVLELGEGTECVKYWIKKYKPILKCEHCGARYVDSHVCNARVRSYYHNWINPQTKDNWKTIRFFPVGSPKSVRRFYMAYDIETYTVRTGYGKQLVPYLLCLQFGGRPDLVKLGEDAATNAGYTPHRTDSCRQFYALSLKDPRIIGAQFRDLRIALHRRLLKYHIQVCFPPRWHDAVFCDREEIVEDMKSNPEDFKPFLLEFMVVGHNITGFDEVVLAAHVFNVRKVNGDEEESDHPFLVRRNFLPRAGKILFNDITYTVPNPTSKKANEDEDEEENKENLISGNSEKKRKKKSKRTPPPGYWKQGVSKTKDYAQIGVRCTVRDTYLLTHTSLRNAAKAYNLSVAKGACPYKAVNSFLQTGEYETEPTCATQNFPHSKYWESPEEKSSALEHCGSSYDIIEEAIRYCLMDVRVVTSLVETLKKEYAVFVRDSLRLPLCRFNVFQRPTVSSNTHALFKQMIYTDHPRHFDSVPDLFAPSEQMYDYVRRSLRGGRCYPSYLGVLDEPVYVYDICGMYASALTHPMPAGCPLDPFAAAVQVSLFQRRLDDSSKLISYFDSDLLPMIVTADLLPPPSDQLDILPPLCSRLGGRLCWTNEPLYGEVITSLDLITCHNRGWTLRILLDRPLVVFPDWKCLASDYVKINIAAKDRAELLGNVTQRSISKLLSNSLYGSFATRLDNKEVVFESDLTPEHEIALRSALISIKNQIFLMGDVLPIRGQDPKTINRYFTSTVAPSRSAATTSSPLERPATNKRKESSGSFCYAKTEQQNDETLKPIVFLDEDIDQLTLLTLEKTSEWIENKRYPTQLASFVLAWTRCFTSEWTNFLYGDESGTVEEKPLLSVYGDTDSLFLTQKGHEKMLKRGRRRLRHDVIAGPMVFDPANPELSWLVECETICADCGAPAFAPRSVFLAPKLYALQDLKCSRLNCDWTGSGKLRAKGHAREQLNFQQLSECYTYHTDQKPVLPSFTGGVPQVMMTNQKTFETSRISMKKTLTAGNRTNKPFTVTETRLTRTLRPWQDKTQRYASSPCQNSSSGTRLFPYDFAHPNPRTVENAPLILSLHSDSTYIDAFPGENKSKKALKTKFSADRSPRFRPY